MHLAELLWTSNQFVAEAVTCTTNNRHKRQTSTPPAGFETAIQAIEGPQTYALDRTATWIGSLTQHAWQLFLLFLPHIFPAHMATK